LQEVQETSEKKELRIIASGKDELPRGIRLSFIGKKIERFFHSLSLLLHVYGRAGKYVTSRHIKDLRYF